MIGYAETVHGPIGLRQRGAMSGATVPASSPPVTGRHRAHARGTPASWCPPPNDRGRALTRISANLVARGCKGIYVPACAVKYPTLLLRPLSRSSSGLCVGGLPARGWWCGVCPSPRWILTPRRYSPKCLEGEFSELRLNGVLRSSRVRSRVSVCLSRFSRAQGVKAKGPILSRPLYRSEDERPSGASPTRTLPRAPARPPPVVAPAADGVATEVPGVAQLPVFPR
jgi:hypothetical protein